MVVRGGLEQNGLFIQQLGLAKQTDQQSNLPGSAWEAEKQMPDVNKCLGRKGSTESHIAARRADVSLFQGYFYFVACTDQIGTRLSAASISRETQHKGLAACRETAQRGDLLVCIVDKPRIIMRTGGRSLQPLDTYFERIGISGYAVWIINK